jgi:CheY-like chemotaxis protein
MNKPLALIIEDDPQLSQIFSLALGGQFTTEAIQDGETALKRLAEVIPNIIVLDLNLPQVPGEQILAYLCSEARLTETRVILATADARQAEYLQDQVDIVLLKPVNPIQLRELAQRMMNIQHPAAL